MSDNVLNHVPEPFWSPLADHECKPIDWLIEGWIPFDSFGVLFGQPSAGKSFSALDISAVIASGRETWHGHKTKGEPMGVFYLCGEGKRGLRQRLEAWRKRGSNDLVWEQITENLHISKTSANLMNSDEVEAMCEDIEKVNPKPGLLVVDTLARNFGGSQENESSDMGQLVRNCDLLRSRLGGMPILVVHHTGLKDTHRPRGSGSLEAATDFMILAEKNADLVNLKVTRMKDGDPAKPLTLKFVRQMIDQDDEGLGVYSSHLVKDGDFMPDQSRLGDNQKNALKYLKDLDRQSKDRGLNGAIMLDDFKESWRLNGETMRVANRILESLEKRGSILIEGEVIRLRQ